MKFTVKTLNSMRYDFEVSGEETVARLKQMIEEKTHIPPARQKLIFLGKVLQNEKKLSEYDLDGKVVHLVESQLRSNPEGSGSSTTAPAPTPAPEAGALPSTTTEQIGDQMIDQIMSSLGVDRSQARITRQNLGNGGIAVSLNVPDGSNEHFDIRIQNETPQSANTANTANTATTTAGATTSGTGSTSQNTATPGNASASNSSSTTPGAPGNAQQRQRPPTADNLDRIINHLRAVRETMRHIPCAADQASGIINDTLVAPCIRRQHTAGPTLEEGATAAEVQQRQTSRESIETYSHIMIDMADVMQEMVRYMNQYARLLHHDPPLEGPNLTYAQNLVDRMSSMFHDVSHAFHILSDYGITLNNTPPRRLWMATLSGGASILLQGMSVNSDAPNLQQVQQRLQQRLQRAAATNTRATATANISTNTTGTSTSGVPAAPPAGPPGGAPPPPRPTNNTGTSTNNIPTNNTGTSTNTTTTNNTGTNPTAFSISYNLPSMTIGPNMGISDIISQAVSEGIQAQQGFQGLPQTAPGGPRNIRSMLHNSLQCSSRHRAFNQPPRCPIHNPPAPHGHGHSHHHAHTHGPATGHGHSHSHGPRPVPPRPAGRGRVPPTAGPPSAPMPAPAPPPNLQNNPLLGQLLAGTMSELDNPEDVNRYMQLVMRMMNNTDYTSQPIAQYWPEIRDLMVPNVTIPDQSHLGDLLHIIASNYSFSDLMTAMNNHEMFDILYRPMRTQVTESVFNNQVPTQEQINNTVSHIIATDRDLIIAFFDIRQNADGDVDEQETTIAMVREFVGSIFRELYNPARGDVAAGFGQVVGRSFLRLVGLIIAYCRYINPNDSRNRLTNQFSGLLQTIIPYHTMTRAELYDNYVVHRPLDTTDDEFVDAQENDENMETHEEEKPEEEEEEEEEEEAPQPSPSMIVDDDEIPDEVVSAPVSTEVVRPAPATEIPAEWKRVIEEDVQKIENTTYGPLSDAYLTSLPAKRRKTDVKSRSDEPGEMLQGLLRSSLPSKEEGEDAQPDPALTQLFKNKLKKDLAKKVKDNEDVNDEQFPSASKLKNG